MKQIGGVWLPDHEQHLVAWMQQKNQVVDGKLTYQWDKQQLAMKWVRNWRTAVDVGAHCGLWSMQLIKRFKDVQAFEPVTDHQNCWWENVVSTSKPDGHAAELHCCALGEADGFVAMETAPGSSGDTRVMDGPAIPGEIPLRRLDSFDLQDVDFIKLDCEGYELHALKGGEEALKRCHPCVIVEQKPGRAKHFGLPDHGAVEYLMSLGAKLRAERSGDFVLSWD